MRPTEEELRRLRQLEQDAACATHEAEHAIAAAKVSEAAFKRELAKVLKAHDIRPCEKLDLRTGEIEKGASA